VQAKGLAATIKQIFKKNDRKPKNPFAAYRPRNASSKNLNEMGAVASLNFLIKIILIPLSLSSTSHSELYPFS
jgi:hypothetical protein